MGEAADAILHGECCAGCGEWFHDEAPGMVRYCSDACGPGTSGGKTARNRRKREKKRNRRLSALAAADTKGWDKLTPYHFRRVIKGENLDWWPSTGKYFWRGQVINETMAKEVMV